MVSTVGDITAELAEVSALLNNPKVGGAAKKTVADSLIAKVATVRNFDASSAVLMHAAVDAAHLLDDVADALRAAVDERLQADLATPGSGRVAGPGPSTQQLLITPTNYLTKSAWIKVQAPTATPQDIMRVISEQYSKLGIRSLHEQTVKSAIMVASCRN